MTWYKKNLAVGIFWVCGVRMDIDDMIRDAIRQEGRYLNVPRGDPFP